MRSPVRHNASPLVSIVIGNYNYARYIGDAIESALNQTYSPTEVIVVDDGSTDGSREVIERYRPDIEVILKRNGGQASVFNAGFRRSAGQIVFFLDSDDILDAGAAETAVPHLLDQDVAKLHWPLAVIDAQGRMQGLTRPTGPLCAGDLRKLVFREGPANVVSAPTSGNAWSRTFLERVFPVPESTYRMNADKYLFEMAPFMGKISKTEKSLSFYRKHGLNSYGSIPFEDQMERELILYEHYSVAAAEFCRKSGVEVDTERWRAASYWHKLKRAVSEIADLPLKDGPILLVDDGTWGIGPVAGRARLPFTESGGQYAGPPADAEGAIHELERLRAQGAAYCVFTWASFWWLEYYAEFARYLGNRYQKCLHNDRLVVFDLSRAKTASLSPPNGCASGKQPSATAKRDAPPAPA